MSKIREVGYLTYWGYIWVGGHFEFHPSGLRIDVEIFASIKGDHTNCLSQ